jgi:PAS domain S-box-containing protein
MKKWPSLGIVFGVFLIASVDVSAQVYRPTTTAMWSMTLGLITVVVVGLCAGLWLSSRHDAAQLRETRQAQDRLAVAMRASGTGFWELNLADNTAYWSPEYKAQLGYSADELDDSFEAWDSRLHPDDRQATLDATARYIANPDGYLTVEYRLRHKDGTYRNFLSRAKGEIDGSRLVRMLGCTIDLTATKTLEAQFRQAQKMEAVGRLAGGIAHDFNNLLTVINGYVEFLLEDHPTGQLASDLQEIQRAGKSAERLTRQLLVFSRTAKQQSSQTNVNQLIADWQRLLGRTLGDDITVAIDLCEEPTTVDLDDQQIEQVIMNLAVNAKDAMPAGGTLKLSTDIRAVHASEDVGTGSLHEGRYVVVSVEDTGTGIPAEVLPHIFEPFFTTKEAGKGTGLGLATVHHVMSGCGGAVSVRTSPMGTRFMLYLPSSKNVHRHQDAASLTKQRTPSPKHVLLIDDDAAVRQIVAREIASAGHRVEAGDTNFAFAALRDGLSFDVLVTDVVMPGISGVELSQRVRARLPRLQTVFITGYADAEITTAFPPNAIVLRKPLARGALHSALDALTLPATEPAGFPYAVRS